MMHLRRYGVISSELQIGNCPSGGFSHVKIASFSPDGSSFIAVLDDYYIALYSTEGYEEGCNNCAEEQVPTESTTALQPKTVIDIYDDVRDIRFFPNYVNSDPDSRCFLVAARGTPIHLYDIRGGNHHFTYKPLNLRDELADAYSLDFQPLGKYFLCGGKGTVHVFDIESPGVNLEMRRLYTNRRSGQCGIIAAISHNPWASSVYACGDYNSNICIYDHNTSRHSSLFGKFTDNVMQIGPVTQLQWVKENLLLLGTKSDMYMRLFDIRGTTEEPVTRFKRAAKSNQRLQFGFKDDRIISGTSDGYLVVYHIAADTPQMEQSISSAPVTSACYHPDRPLVLTASGTRNFGTINDNARSVAKLDLWSIEENVIPDV